MNRRVVLAMLWAGVLLGFLGLYLGTSSRSGDLGGATVTCGSPWSPNSFARFYRGVDSACQVALGNLGTVAVILTLVGTIMVITVLAIAAMTPAAPVAPGTQDHP